MAKVLFVMRYPLDGWDNLKNKFDGQMAAVEALAHEAWHIGYNAAGMWLCRGDKRTLLKRCALARMPGYTKTYLYVDLMEAVRRACAKQHFDALYIRYLPVFWNAPTALRFAKKTGARLILEHPTYPVENGRVTSWLRRPVFWYNDRVFARLEKLLDLYVLIGNPGGESLHGIPAMNVVNGVDVERLPLHQPLKEGPVSLLALASMSRWQGYDRLIHSLAAYDGTEKVVVHMVGGEGDGSLAEWRQLAQDLGVQDRVIFHGEVFGERLNALAAACDLGVGGLALHRKQQFKSMTLKLREYMARGLPFLYAVEDPSVPREPRFCLQLPNDDSPIDMTEIVRFALRTRLDDEAPRLMRKHAREHMSWQGVMKSILEKVEII